MLQTRIIPSKPALILEGKKKNLVVTDVHIGFESNLWHQMRFSLVKTRQLMKQLQNLSEIIDAEKPDSVILLGDIKSSIREYFKK